MTDESERWLDPELRYESEREIDDDDLKETERGKA